MMRLVFFIFFFFYSLLTHAELRVCSKDYYKFLDPHQAQNMLEKQLANGLIYETVVKYNPRSKKLVPFLIKRWSSYDKDKVYNLYFERKISFISPNKVKKKYELSASDFLFSLNLYLNKVKEGKIKNNYAVENIERIEISEPKVVTIKLKKSDPDFMKNLAEEMGVVLSKDYYDDLQKRNKLSEFYKYPVGTGAYRYKKTEPKELKLYRQEGYHFGVPDVEEIIFNYVKEKDRREKYLKSDLCDIAVDISDSTLPAGFVLHKNKEDIAFFIEQNKNSPLKRITKTHPLYKFLNMKEIAGAIVSNGKEAKSFVPSESDLYKEANFNYIFDSKELEKSFKKYGVSKVKIYFDNEVKNEIHALSSFLDIIKNNFLSIGVEVALGKENDADLIVRKKSLNGFYEKGLQVYFSFWNGEKNKKWFQWLFSELGKSVDDYPVVYSDFYIGVSPKVSKFYSFRSNSFDLTTAKIEEGSKK